MRFMKQKHLHDPENGIFGDCYRTVVACLLDLELDDVPHEHRRMSSAEHNAWLDAWLKKHHNVYRIEMALYSETVQNALVMAGQISGEMPYMFSGKSKTGTNHVVIGYKDAIVHDPAINDSGIVGPTDVGQYWVGWLVRRPD